MPANLDLSALKETFDQDGFVVIRQYLTSLELTALREHADVVMKDFEYNPKFKGVRKNLNAADDWFKVQLEAGAHVPLIAAMLLDKPRPASAAFFDKPIGESVEIVQHVDGMGKQDGATMWIALDPSDLANGCLCYVKGSHRDVHSATALASFSEDSEGATCIPAQPGDAIIHSSRTVHWSRKSCSSDRRRRAVSYFYWATSTLGEDFPGKPHAKQELEVDIAGKSVDVQKGLMALKALDRDWAKMAGIGDMFRQDPEKFLNGLKAKDAEAFNFIVSQAGIDPPALGVKQSKQHIGAVCAFICLCAIVVSITRRPKL